jgi:hypothetical protein
MRARYKRYSEEIVTKILSHLEQGETIAYSCKEAGISQVSFNNWCRSKPDFNDRVNKAMETYKKNCPENLKVIAKGRLKQVLEEGVIIKRTRTTRIERVHKVPIYENDVIVDYREKWRQVEVNTETDNTDMGIPQWALDRVLPPPPKDLESAVKMIEAYGLKTIVANTEVFREWLIAQETNQNNGEGINRGLTESEANDIRAKILGIEADTAL